MEYNFNYYVIPGALIVILFISVGIIYYRTIKVLEKLRENMRELVLHTNSIKDALIETTRVAALLEGRANQREDDEKEKLKKEEIKK